MSGNSEKWLTFLDPMMAKLTGNDYAEKHGKEIDTAAVASAAILGTIFAPYLMPAAAGAVGAGAGAAEAGLTASEIAALDAAGGYTAATGAIDGAAASVGSGGLLSAGAAGGAVEGLGGGTASLFGPTLDAAAVQGLGGGTASLFGPEAGLSGGLLESGATPTMGQIANGASAANAPTGPSAWDRFSKGMDAYNKFNQVTKPIQGLLAPPQSPQAPQPRPLTQRQAQQQTGPVDWAGVFGQGLSDEEIRRRYLASLNGANVYG